MDNDVPITPSEADRAAHAPSLLLTLSEGPRVAASIGALALGAPWLAAAPRGDGHPVLVLPGLMASDASTAALRRFLKTLGYKAYKWHLGRNVGPTAAVRAELPVALARIAARNGAKVSVIGWSLGGIYARDLAHRHPQHVRQVITLASPYRLQNPAQSRAGNAFKRYSHLHVWEGDTDRMTGMSPQPLSVPSTSIYSRTDGIVAWQHCIEPPGIQTENIRVRTSHLGVGFDPPALYAVADRLAQQADDWRPFRAPVYLRPFFPAPDEPHLPTLDVS